MCQIPVAANYKKVAGHRPSTSVSNQARAATATGTVTLSTSVAE